MFRGRPRDDERAEPTVRVNQRVRAPEVRLIGADGGMVGIMTSAEALARARDAGLDLVEVNPKAAPPVCRLMDYGKFKYEQKKQAAAARKRQTVIDIKEIKFRPKTDDHDYDFKMRHIRRFLAEGDKAKITVRFRGREMAHPQVAKQLLERIVSELKEDAIIEQESKLEGRTMYLLLAPKGGPLPLKPLPVRPAGPVVVDRAGRPGALPAAPGAPAPAAAAPAPGAAVPAPAAAPAEEPLPPLDDEDDDDDEEDDADRAERELQEKGSAPK